MNAPRQYRLIGADGTSSYSSVPGQFGGHRRNRVYGRLDCKVARRAIAMGGSYGQQRVFFADEKTAIAAGYRPCAKCMPDEYKMWKAKQK